VLLIFQSLQENNRTPQDTTGRPHNASMNIIFNQFIDCEPVKNLKTAVARMNLKALTINTSDSSGSERPSDGILACGILCFQACGGMVVQSFFTLSSGVYLHILKY